jgi:hypothetical protein
MGWSEKYKKSIDCNNPKGFSQKAHCAGKKKRKNEDMVFEQITEDILNEKLITYGNRKPYGQVVFMAGGAGSGKGFAISNFVDSASFKIRDVDEMKKQLQILNRMGKLDIRTILKKYGRNIKLKDLDLIRKIEADGFRLQNLNLKNPDHVYALHILVKAMGIKDKSLANLLAGKDNPETLPNIMFDITAKDVTDITSVLPLLKNAGYKADNIHLTWVLTNYVTAMVNNKSRSRMVPEDILLKTHEGAANTVWGLVTKALPKGMNGRVDVILNNPQHTVFYTDADGRTINGKVKGFLSLPLKKAKGGIFPEKVWKDRLFNWVKDNAPDSITSNMEESVEEGMVKPKSGHTYYQLTKDFPIKYITGKYGMGLEVPGVLIKNKSGYIDGKKGAYLIDYFDALYYVDMKKKFASPVYSLRDQDKFQRGSITQVDMAPEYSDWKRYIKENIKERINLFVEENEPTNPDLWDRAIAAAKAKYDVYPSAYANAFASKWYGDKGGKWRTKKD